MEVVSNTTRVARRVREHVIPTRGMTNITVYKFCKEVCTSDFIGVYSVDSIPKRTLAGRGNFFIVLNLGDGRKKEDGHFVAVAAYPDVVLYMDPFGLEPPTDRYVRPFLRLCRRPVYFNHVQVQDITSSYCGLYAILFVWHLDAGRPFKLRFRRRGNLMINDRTCMDYLRRLLAITFKR
jgi:hypothetical protein